MLCRHVHLLTRPWTVRWGCRCTNPKTWRLVAVASAHERQTANKNGKSISTELDIGRQGTKNADPGMQGSRGFVIHIWAKCHWLWRFFIAGHQFRAILSTPLLVENIFSSKSHPLHCRHRQLERAAHYLEPSPASPLQKLAGEDCTFRLYCKPNVVFYVLISSSCFVIIRYKF